MRTTPFNLSKEQVWGIEINAEKDVTTNLTLSGSANYFSRQKYWEPSGIRLNFIYQINQQNKGKN